MIGRSLRLSLALVLVFIGILFMASVEEVTAMELLHF